MKILEETSTRLVIKETPVGLWVLCFGLAALFAGLGFFMGPILGLFLGSGLAGPIPSGILGPQILGYAAVIPLAAGLFMIKTRELSFDSSSGLVKLDAKGVIGGTSHSEYPLKDFQGAHLAIHRTRNQTTYRTILMFGPPHGQVAVTPYGTGGSGPGRMVSKINEWLMTSRGVTTVETGQGINLSIPGLHGINIVIQRRSGGSA